uniref:Avidin n=1 Tax=Strigops habroptila TaxID=2489341 RepID=A0A672VAL8_STRHB
MVHATAFLLVLSLAVVAPVLSTRKVTAGLGCAGQGGQGLHCSTGDKPLSPQCVLTGRWTNDLGSNMTIMAVNAKGEFLGSYHTAVTVTGNDIKVSPLQGSQHRTNENSQATFGFTVNWSFSDSVTVFTGQCFVDETGKEVLKTMWLLRSHVDSIKDDWTATRVGVNVFTRLRSKKE